VQALEPRLARGLPQYRYAIRTGRLHQFLVVSNDSPGAAIVMSLGCRIKVFGGHRNQWIQGLWTLAMVYAAVLSVLGAVGVMGGWPLLALPVLAVGFDIRRRLCRSIIRDVVAHLEKTLR
jgi:hypothetical protein